MRYLLVIALVSVMLIGVFATRNDDSTATEVVLTEQGFVPDEITIPVGTTVTFSTNVDRPFWPASNLHPNHDIYPEFDPERPVPPDETWHFTFDRVGDWNMHDHIRSYYTGTIYVTPE